MSYTPTTLSGSTNGKGILLTGTTSAAKQTVHTATSTAGELDQPELYAYNDDVSTRNLILEIGASGVQITLPIPAQSGLSLAFLGIKITGGVVISAWASVASKVSIFGGNVRYAP